MMKFTNNNISKLIYKKRKKFLVFRRKEEKENRLLEYYKFLDKKNQLSVFGNRLIGESVN
jgi:hypothetical protein